MMIEKPLFDTCKFFPKDTGFYMAPTVCSWIEPEHIRRIQKIPKEVQNISDYIAKVS